jgi:hypothetical protein
MPETIGPNAAHNSLMEEGAEQYCSARSWCAVAYEHLAGPLQAPRFVRIFCQIRKVREERL